MLDTPWMLVDTEEADWAELSPEGAVYEMDDSRRTPFRSWTRLVQYNYMGEGAVVLDLATEEGKAGLEFMRQKADEGCTFVIHNSLYDQPKLWKLGIRPTNLFDTMTASQMIWCGAVDKRHALDKVIFRETGTDPYAPIVKKSAVAASIALVKSGKLNFEMTDDYIKSQVELGKKVLQKSNWGKEVLTPEQIAYATADVGEEYKLTLFSLAKQLKDYALEDQFALEMMILPIIAQMSEDGMKFNLEKWKNYIYGEAAKDAELQETLLLQLDKWNQEYFPHDYLITLKRKNPLPFKAARILKDGTVKSPEVPAQEVGDLQKIQSRPAFLPYKVIEESLFALEEGDIHIGALIRQELGLGNNAEDIVALSKPIHLRKVMNALLGLEGEGFDEGEVSTLIEVATAKGKPEVAAWLTMYAEEAKLRKLVSTYGESYWKYADENGYIHANFTTTEADTNRVQADKPNVLNMPRPMQKKLWCVEEGEAMVKADYSAQEARLLFYLGGQKDVYDRLLAGLDIHTMSLSMFNGLPYDSLVIKGGTKDKVKPEYDEGRSDMKPLTFAPCFGCGPGKAATILGVSFKEGKKWLDRYWATYPEVKKMQELQAYKAIHLGYVTDLSFGRKRFFFKGKKQQELLDQGKTLEDACYDFRNPAFNYACQASGASILRFALLKVSQFIKENPQYGAKLRLTVHDAIVLSCKAEHAPEVGFHLKLLMEQAASEVVPGIYIGVDLDIYYDKTAPSTFPQEIIYEQSETAGTDTLRQEHEDCESEEFGALSGICGAGESLESICEERYPDSEGVECDHAA